MWLNELRQRRLGWPRAIGRKQPRPRRNNVRLTLEHLEHRLMPATFNAPDVPSLIADINTANGNGVANTINLTALNGLYVLSAADNSTDGATGLPVITSPFLLTINGNRSTIERNLDLSPQPTLRFFDVAGGAALSLNNLTLQFGLANGAGVAAEGAAILNAGTLILSHDVIKHNWALGIDGADGSGADGASSQGGGIYNATGANLTMTACTLSRNIAQGGVGGAGGTFFANGGSGGFAAGGAIFNNGGSVLITACNVSENSAFAGSGGNGGSLGNGGAAGQAFGGCVASFGGIVTILNTTVSGGVAIAGGGGQGAPGGNGGIAEGGGLFNSAGSLTLVSCTIAGGNEAFAGAGSAGGHPGASLGGGISAVSPVAVENTIIAGNFVAPPGSSIASSSDVSGVFTDNGHNFIGDGDGSPFVNGSNGDQVGSGTSTIDPMLGPLQNNGGPTQTLMPLPGSPVIDAGDNSAAPLTDQRGFRRIAKGTYIHHGTATAPPVIDIGAVEYQRQDLVGRVSQSGQWWVGLSNGSSAFSNSLFTTWSPAATWVDVHTGDFTGDGRDDIVGRDLATGNWWVGVSNGSSFVTSLWGSWSPAVTWVDVQVGDFTGDGKMDIAGRILQSGQWWVAQSTGSSFVNSLWTTWNPAVTWVDVKVGDFNGDGKADITGRVLESGQWWTGISTGSSFTTSLWATWSPSVTWVDVNVGDFNGDGKADITGRVLQSGQWWTGISTGSSFSTSLWGVWSTAVTWVDVKVGDFNGDGMTDIVGRVLESGQWWVGQSSGSGFTNALWATWSPAVTWVDVQVGDFTGDGKADITGRILQSGDWWTGVSTGSSFATSMWGHWYSGVNWVDVQVGEYA